MSGSGVFVKNGFEVIDSRDRFDLVTYRLAEGPDQPITKTTGGLIVVPANHPVALRHGAKWGQIARVGRSACDQCRFCTELCPRYLLGHPVEPHRAMQALGFTRSKDRMIAGTLYCCECNLCSLYSCPEDLDPKTVCAESKPLARERRLVFSGDAEKLRPHPLAAQRRVPTHRLVRKLSLGHFVDHAPLRSLARQPTRVVLPLKQHAGSPAIPVVRTGDRVRVGTLVASPPSDALGANLHASIDGIVRATEPALVIQG
jgi:Na+-translocating ferredoxin:NAD+ oxidoreductase RnfC subunit